MEFEKQNIIVTDWETEKVTRVQKIRGVKQRPKKEDPLNLPICFRLGYQSKTCDNDGSERFKKNRKNDRHGRVQTKVRVKSPDMKSILPNDIFFHRLIYVCCCEKKIFLQAFAESLNFNAFFSQNIRSRYTDSVCKICFNYFFPQGYISFIDCEYIKNVF